MLQQLLALCRQRKNVQDADPYDWEERVGSETTTASSVIVAGVGGLSTANVGDVAAAGFGILHFYFIFKFCFRKI